ncbi:MAG: SycD/LcrH family type III secretion system chaperone [Chlamydiota bacterium]|nr:SycD/LcrH family type III secretion system chaperone [Chlamydiota bacterium]
MKGEQKNVSKATKQVAEKLKDEAAKGYEEAAANIVKKGVLPQEALGMDDQMLEGIYGQAYRLYNTGKYGEAGQIFRLLIMVNSMEPKYSMGLAACFHMLKEYKNAIDTYTLCSIIDPDNPVPQYHISDCYIQMSDQVSAIIALKMAIKRAGTNPDFKTLVDRAKLTIESLKKGLKGDQKKKDT